MHAASSPSSSSSAAMQRFRRRTDPHLFQKRLAVCTNVKMVEHDGETDGMERKEVGKRGSLEPATLESSPTCIIPSLPVEVYIKIFSHLPPLHLPLLLRLSKSFHDIIEHTLSQTLPPHLPTLKALSTSLHRRITIEQDILTRTLLNPSHLPRSQDVDELRRYARPNTDVMGIMSCLLSLAPCAPSQADPNTVYSAHVNFPGGAMPPSHPVRMMVGVAAFGLLPNVTTTHTSVQEDQWRLVQGLMNQPGFKPWLKKLATDPLTLSERKVREALQRVVRVAKGRVGEGVFRWRDVSNALTVDVIVAMGGLGEMAFGEAVQAWISLPPIVERVKEVDGVVGKPVKKRTVASPTSDEEEEWERECFDGGFLVRTLAEMKVLTRRVGMSCGPAARFLNLVVGMCVVGGRVRPLRKGVERLEKRILGCEKVMERIRERRRVGLLYTASPPH